VGLLSDRASPAPSRIELGLSRGSLFPEVVPGSETFHRSWIRARLLRSLETDLFDGVMSMTTPIRVAVTGAGGQIGYALLFRLASGQAFGPDQPVAPSMLEITRRCPRSTGR